MKKTVAVVKRVLDGTFGRLIFPLGLLFLGSSCTGILWWFAAHPGSEVSDALLVTMACIGNLIVAVAGAIGMQHYRTLGYLDALRRKSENEEPAV